MYKDVCKGDQTNVEGVGAGENIFKCKLNFFPLIDALTLFPGNHLCLCMAALRHFVFVQRRGPIRGGRNLCRLSDYRQCSYFWYSQNTFKSFVRALLYNLHFCI